MKKRLLVSVWLSCLFLTANVQGQVQADPEKRAQEIQGQRERASKWVDKLELDDREKEARVVEVVTTHLMEVRDWHNTHPYTEVPEGINPRTGERLTKLDRQVIAASTKPASIHENLMDGLRADLTEEQIEKVLDEYTIGKFDFTLKGYRECILDMTAEEEAEIVRLLKQAREEAVDYKNADQISTIFKIYKTKIELYLYQNDRNWKKIYKEWVDRIKASKAS